MAKPEIFSSEICDLENFIDSYVGPDIRRTGSSNSGSHGNWSRTHSFEESSIGSYGNNELQTSQSTGAEVWGRRSGGVPWSSQAAGSQVRFPQNEWNNHKPTVQERFGPPPLQDHRDQYSGAAQWNNMVQQPGTTFHQMVDQQDYQNYQQRVPDFHQFESQQQQHYDQQQFGKPQQQHFDQQQQHFDQQQQLGKPQQQHFDQQQQHFDQQQQQHFDQQQQLGKQHQHPYDQQQQHFDQQQYEQQHHYDQNYKQLEYEQQYYHENQQQNPNEIQAIVSDLIRQNNINRPKQQLPSWIDTSRPPPPLHHADPVNQPDPNMYGHNFHDQEEILHSMTFQRTDQPIPRSQPQELNFQQIAKNDARPRNVEHTQRAQQSPHVQRTQHEQHVQHSSHMQHANHAQKPKTNHTHNGANRSPLHAQNSVTDDRPLVDNGKKNIEPNSSHHSQSSQQNSRAVSKDSGKHDPMQKSGLVRRPSDKYPNSRLRMSAGSDSNDTSVEKTPPKPKGPPAQTQGVNFGRRQQHTRSLSNEVFENEQDQGWKTQNIQVQIHNKPGVRRKSSAADDDRDWRRKDGDSPDKAYRNKSSSSSEGNNRFVTKVEQQPERTNKSNRKSSRDDKYQTEQVGDHNSRQVVAAQSKINVQSWIEGVKSHDNSASKEIEKLRISGSEDDLLKFIEMTQSYATTEAKMREVAEILCNKALKNPKFGSNAALLCSRMSHLMVHGTKFRSVVLSVMQGHHKNRDRLFLTSLRGDTRWYGFATFLVELFMHVRTSGKERLNVLVEPVVSTLLQVLTGEKTTTQHVDCFRDLFSRCGPALEVESPSRMSELMSEIRDCCVVSKNPSIRRSLLQCVRFYATKWKV